MPNPEMKTLTVGENTFDIRDGRIGDLADLDTTNKSSVVAAINEAAQGGASVEPYTSTPADLGAASAGSSNKYSRGDHVHKLPTPADIGAVAKAQGLTNADKVLMVNNSGNVALADIPTKYAQPANQFPQNLGIPAPGSSTYYSRADHSHAMPSAADVGAIEAPSSASDGDFLTYNATAGAWVATTVPSASGVSF